MKKDSSVFWKWISLVFFCFSWLEIFSSFFRHFLLFLLITFHFHLFFHFHIFDLLFSWSPVFFVNNNFTFCNKKKLFNLSLFHACVTSVSPFAHRFIHLLSFFLFVFSRFYHMCFPFPSFVFSVHNLSERKVYGTVANLSISLSLFCWALVWHFLVFACLSLFRNFLFLIYSHLFLNICLFCSRSWMFLPLLLPFYVSLFFLTLFGLIIVFSLFSPVTYFLFFSHKAMFFVLFPLVLSLFLKKPVFLFC